MSDYRLDGRSTARFAKDIKQNHQKEALIAVRLCITIHSKTDNWPTLTPTGVDATGAFIENIKDVIAEPDFRIGDRLVEITRSDTVCNRYFHQKIHKVIRCLKGEADLVFVNGYSMNNQPKYLWLTSKELEPFVSRALTKYGEVPHPGGGGIWTKKPACRFDVYWFDQAELWKPLPSLTKNIPIPEEYKQIIEATR
jgi:hypothetical protein